MSPLFGNSGNFSVISGDFKSPLMTIFFVVILEKDGNEVDIDPEFETLAWWKANNLKYCILSKMGRDILVIPMSSVASESAISVGGRVIEPHKASLSPETVQMLLCGSDWVRALHGVKKKIYCCCK